MMAGTSGRSGTGWDVPHNKRFWDRPGVGGSMESCYHPGGICAAGPEMRTDQFLS